MNTVKIEQIEAYAKNGVLTDWEYIVTDPISNTLVAYHLFETWEEMDEIMSEWTDEERESCWIRETRLWNK